MLSEPLSDYSLSVGWSSSADLPQLHLRSIGITFRYYSLFHPSANNYIYFRIYLIRMQYYDFYRTSVESFDVKEGGPSGTCIHDLRHSVPTLLPTEFSVRQWNWSIRDRLYSSYSLYSGIHTVIELLDYTYLIWEMLLNHCRAYSLPVGGQSTPDHPQWHHRSFGISFRCYSLFHPSAKNYIYFRK